MDRDKGLRVFFSYSHRDQRYLHELKKHLANLREEGLISLWHDRTIRPGEDWEKRIRDQLERADVILLLISSDFNDSDFCRREEMARAIQRHQQGKAKVIPVVVRHVEALPAEVAHIQAIPADLKPITSFKPQDEGYMRIAKGIREVLAGLAPEYSHEDATIRPIEIDVPDTRPLTVCLEFQAAGDGYELEIQIGCDRATAVKLPQDVRLGASEKLRLGGGVQATLGELVRRLIDFQQEDLAWFEERAQLEIGRKLFEETVGRIERLADRDQVDLRIVTDDEHLLRLPWPC